jgi:hypothetical protein
MKRKIKGKGLSQRIHDGEETMTLFDKCGENDNPSVTICAGHVQPKAFDEAFAAEGWQSDPVDEADLRYEYWEPLTNGGWKISLPGKRGAVPVTVMRW